MRHNAETGVPKIDNDSAEHDQLHANESSSVGRRVAYARQGFAANPIARSMAEGGPVRHSVHWYGYISADDTVEPLDHIAEQFFSDYWQRAGMEDASRHGQNK